MLTVHRTMRAEPDAAWKILVDLGMWPRWGLTVGRAELDGPDDRLTLGATGRVWTPVGIALPFAITEFDEGNSWAWTVGGVPATRHLAEPVDGGCRVTFAVPWWAPAYLAVCAVALRRIEQLVLSEH